MVGPCTSWGGGYKASCVAGEAWRTWLGWRRRSGAGAGAGRAGRSRAGRGTVARRWGRSGRAGRRVWGEEGGGGDVPEPWEGRDCVRNVANVRSKERARRDFVAKNEVVWAKNAGVWAKNAFCGQKMNFRRQRKIHHLNNPGTKGILPSPFVHIL